MPHLLRVAGPVTAFALVFAPAPSVAQAATDPAACTSGSPLTGAVHDTTGASVANATVVLDNGTAVQTGENGRFQLGCVTPGAHRLHVEAESFCRTGGGARCQPQAG